MPRRSREPGVPRPRTPRRYSPVVQRIAAEHGIDLDAVAGTAATAGCASRTCCALVDAPAPRRSDPPLHIESPYRPDAGAGDGGGQQLSRMRRAIGEHMKRSLRDRGDVHDVDRGRHGARRGARAGAARA